ncbi:MAG: protein-L-isoaspartate O-methyltransferase [Burkholderiales bacterium]|nr:protein-L-isoaspartate O-methyltransferase [Burkholderiales bacterium]
MNPQLDVSRARFNMIEQQIRPWDVLDQDVLDLLDVIRREEFVPPAHRQLAFSDLEIPLRAVGGALAAGARMWAPRLEARVLQELAVKHHDAVLEIGTGSGYFAALLAHRARSVTSVEIDAGLKAFAEENLRRAGVGNVRVVEGDGARGFGADSYDVIVLTGSTPVLPEAFVEQLRPHGRLFAVVGDAPAMAARLLTKAADGQCSTVTLFETDLAPLLNAAQPPRFRF